jgi:hypothetical protein
MPNWCSTDYQIVGNKNEVENLYNKFKQVVATDRSYEKDGTTFLPNSSWLGYVVKDILGINPELEIIPCRGTIEWLEEDLTINNYGTASFQLTTETAWSDCRKLFYTLMEKFDIEVFFITEELGCGIFETNDESGRYFTCQYIYDDFDEGMEYYTFDNMAEEIQKRTGKLPVDYKDAEKIIEEFELDEQISIHEVSYVSLSDF